MWPVAEAITARADKSVVGLAGLHTCARFDVGRGARACWHVGAGHDGCFGGGSGGTAAGGRL